MSDSLLRGEMGRCGHARLQLANLTVGPKDDYGRM